MDSNRKSRRSQRHPKLPRDCEAERYLLSAVLFWPERAGEIVPLVEPSEMLDELHQKLWAAFRGQLALCGEVDYVEIGRRLKCAYYLCELYLETATSCHARYMAERIKAQARARELYGVLNKAEQSILQGTPVSSILPRLNLALVGIGQGVMA